MKPRVWPIVISALIGFAILCSLGVWQVQRLGQKTALIAALEQRMSAAPISLAQAMDKQANGENIEYLKVQFQGQATPAKAMYKVASLPGKAAWEMISPFLTTDGIFVLVDQGATTEKIGSVTQRTTETMTGIIRLHNKGRGLFDNDNDPASNVWYWWDVPTMLADAAAPVDAKVATFIVQRLPDGTETMAPIAQLPKVELANNHLGYAITWFGLAAALAGVAIGFGLSMLKYTDA